MIKQLVRRVIVRPQAGFFNWFKKEEEKKEEKQPTKDDWNPKNWRHMGPVLQQLKHENQNKSKLLPFQSDEDRSKLTVVMELDEVMIYTFTPDPRENWMTAPLRQYDYSLDLPEFETWIDVYKREHLDEFMEYWLNECEPVIWSSGHPAYVKLVMKHLCPGFPETHIFTQEECNLVEYPEETLELFVKDIDRLGRDLKRVVYVDSKPLNFWGSGSNSYPVSVFTADNTDRHIENELLTLVEHLRILKQEADVRIPLAKRFKIEQTQRECKLIL